MVCSRSSLISIPIIIVLSFGFLYGQDQPVAPVQPPDSTQIDSTAVPDSSDVVDKTDLLLDRITKGIADTLAEQQISYFPEENIPPYYQTIIAGKSYGDYLWYKPGVLPLQHGSPGQAEILTRSVMLPGLGVVHNGLPVFHQGNFFPFRSGADLNVLMFENVGEVDIAPMHSIDLFSQGESLTLKSMFWPSNDNPSSVTVARGPYNYERSGWRFSRRFTENAALTFTAGFKESFGYYGGGADYDDFSVAGSFAMRPRPDTEFKYSFYQHKAKQGILQFDRVIFPTLRANHDQNFHAFKGKHYFSELLQFEVNLFRQKNYNHLFDDGVNYHLFVRDDIWGGKSIVTLIKDRNNLNLEIGGQRHLLKSPGRISARSTTMGITLSDSITLNHKQNIVLTARARHNNINEYTMAGSAKFGWHLNEKTTWNLSAGRFDCLPDIYSLYYNHPAIIPEENSYISSYTYIANPDLNSRRFLFIKTDADCNIYNSITLQAGLSYEKVYDDMVPVVVESSTVWQSYQNNINYKRMTLTLNLGYAVTKYFEGSSGATYFKYDPGSPIPGIRFSPSAILYSMGELKIEHVLKGIDLSGVYHLRYLTKTDYSGFSSVVENRYSNNAAIVLDGSIVVQFGSFQFRLCEDNILDYLTGNKYNVWGEYVMPPGSVWWQFTWNFKN